MSCLKHKHAEIDGRCPGCVTENYALIESLRKDLADRDTRIEYLESCANINMSIGLQKRAEKAEASLAEKGEALDTVREAFKILNTNRGHDGVCDSYGICDRCGVCIEAIVKMDKALKLIDAAHPSKDTGGD